MIYTLHNFFSEIPSHEWNELLSESVTNTPFLRHEYQNAWWEHRGGGEWKNARLVLVSARQSGRLIGVAPLFLAEHEKRLSLLLVGSIEISDYLDLIVRAGDHALFLNGLLDFLSTNLPSWVALDWYNVPDVSPTLEVLANQALHRGWDHHQEMYRPTPRIALHGSFEEYLSRVVKKQRHEIRRKLRRAEESDHAIHWYISPMLDVTAEIQSFLALMEFDSHKAAFLSQPMRAQMSTIIRAAHENGWLWLAFLEVDGNRVAAALNFIYGEKLWGYNAGVNRDFMELSPGWVLLANTLQWACENNMVEFDFMRGDEEYKYRFGAINQYVMRARLIRH